MYFNKTRNGTYRYQQKYKDPLTEKYKIVSCTLASNSKQAQNKAQKILNDKINQLLQYATTNVTEKTIAEIYQEYFEIQKQKVKISSIRAESTLWRGINKRFDTSIKIKNLTYPFLQKFLDDLYFNENFSYSYVSNVKNIFNKLFKFSKKRGYIFENIVSDVTIEKKRTTNSIASKYYEPNELSIILSEVRKTNERYGDLLEIISLTGLRYGEISALTFGDFQSDKINVNKTFDYESKESSHAMLPPKNESSNRTVLLSNRAIELFQRNIMFSKSFYQQNGIAELNYIFINSNGFPLKLRTINQLLKRIELRLKADESLNFDKKISTHVFRHTHISMLSELNIPLKAIMERVGHANPDTTLKIYTHVTEKTSENLINLLNEKEKREN